MRFLFLLFILISSFQLRAQNPDIVKAFDSVVLNSNNWTEYRVIKKVDLSAYKDKLIANRDSVNNVISSLSTNISNLEQKLNTLEKENNSLKEQLTALENSKDDIEFFSIALPKTTYSVLVWSIIIILLVVLAFVSIKLRNRILVTDEIKENLENTTKEFEDYKHRALEKQQKLGRELIDTKKLLQARNSKKS